MAHKAQALGGAKKQGVKTPMTLAEFHSLPEKEKRRQDRFLAAMVARASGQNSWAAKQAARVVQ